MAMKCFDFTKRDEPKTTTTAIKSVSVRSSNSVTSVSTDRDLRGGSGSDFNSQNVSDFSSASASSTKNSFAALSQRQTTNLRVFTFSELKSATKNFSRSLMIGEGGFGGVYRGVIRNGLDSKRIDIAVKQLSRRGLQVKLFSTLISYTYIAL